MGGNQSLTPDQLAQQNALQQQQLGYYSIANALGQEQYQSYQPQIGVPLSGFQSMGFSPQSIDPWSYSGGGYGGGGGATFG